VLSASLKNQGTSSRGPGLVYFALSLRSLLPSRRFVSRIRSSHNLFARSMCRISISHTTRHRNTSESLICRLGILNLGSYYHNRVPRWAYHDARMPMNRAPRQLITGWVAHPRQIGCPEINFGCLTLRRQALRRQALRRPTSPLPTPTPLLSAAETFPLPSSPDLVRAPHPSTIHRSARRRPGRPVRFPRRPW
jgi:hypothetical protein